MSFQIVRRARVKVQDGKVLFQIASYDIGDPPYPGPDFGKRDEDFGTLEEVPLDDHEGIAKFAEFLAGEYDSGQCQEAYREHDGLCAYKLWANRVKRGTGITLRKPRLSEVLGRGVPQNISGVPGKVPFIPKGTVISREKAKELIEAGERFTASVSTPYCPDLNAAKVRFGFIRDDEVCFFKSRCRRRGYCVEADTTITLLEDIGPDTTYGDVVPMETIAGVESTNDLCAHLRQDLFVIVDRDLDGESEDEPRVLGAETHNLAAHKEPRTGMRFSAVSESERIRQVRQHKLIWISSLSDSTWDLPSLFTCENAERMLDRMNRFMPERNWHSITLARLAASLIAIAIAR